MTCIRRCFESGPLAIRLSSGAKEDVHVFGTIDSLCGTVALGGKQYRTWFEVQKPWGGVPVGLLGIAHQIWWMPTLQWSGESQGIHVLFGIGMKLFTMDHMWIKSVWGVVGGQKILRNSWQVTLRGKAVFDLWTLAHCIMTRVSGLIYITVTCRAGLSGTSSSACGLLVEGG